MEKTVRIVVIGGVLGVLCAGLLGQLKSWKGRPGTDDLLPCPPSDPSKPCIPESRSSEAHFVAKTIRDEVHKRAVMYDCGDTATMTRNMTLADLQPFLALFPESKNMSDVLSLFLYNPHWHVRDILESSKTAVPLSCQISLAVRAIWARLKLAIVIVMVGALVVTVVQRYLSSRQQEYQATFEMVERIIAVLKHHNDRCQRKNDILPYLAIVHVRDMLIPPSERERKKRLWEAACRWIDVHESRVRVEVQRIAGEDQRVWKWIQKDPPPTEEPSPTAWPEKRSPASDWGGQTFEDYPSVVAERIAPPLGTPSPCVRLKNMFEPTKRMDAEQVSELENSVLDRCIPHGSVVHIYVDKKSTFGCVYFKMDSISSAKGAYKAVHGGWYKGKLVTAKYIPETKYHKWFPVAATAKYPILPSSS